MKYKGLRPRHGAAPRVPGHRGHSALLHHPKLGASWEGFAIEQVLATEPRTEASFWATRQGAEIDLLLPRRGKLFGVECKRVDAPRMTPSMRIALAELGLERIAVIYPGSRRYALAHAIDPARRRPPASVGLPASRGPRRQTAEFAGVD